MFRSTFWVVGVRCSSYGNTTTCLQLGNDTTYDTEKKNPTSHDVADTLAVRVGRTCREDTNTCHQNQLRTTSKTATFPAKTMTMRKGT